MSPGSTQGLQLKHKYVVLYTPSASREVPVWNMKHDEDEMMQSSGEATWSLQQRKIVVRLRGSVKDMGGAQQACFQQILLRCAGEIRGNMQSSTRRGIFFFSFYKEQRSRG